MTDIRSNIYEQVKWGHVLVFMYKLKQNNIKAERVKAFIFILICFFTDSIGWADSVPINNTVSLSGAITIAGTGDSQSVLREMAKAFKLVHPDVTVTIPDSIGSSGGIKALTAGKADLARVARPLKTSETDKNKNLTYHQFGWSPVVCVVHPSVMDINSISYTQIVSIYSGKTIRWEQIGVRSNKIYPIAREDGDSSFREINKYIPGFSDIESMRAQVMFTTPETVQALIEHQGTIGFLPLSEARKTNLRILSLNGIDAESQSVQDQSYPLQVPLALVSNGNPSGLNKAFIDFIHSRQGQDILFKHGTFPMTSEKYRSTVQAQTKYESGVTKKQ